MEFDWKFGKQPLNLNQPSYGFTNTLVLSECNVSVNSLSIVMNSDDLRPGTRALDDRLSHSKPSKKCRNRPLSLPVSRWPWPARKFPIPGSLKVGDSKALRRCSRSRPGRQASAPIPWKSGKRIAGGAVSTFTYNV